MSPQLSFDQICEKIIFYCQLLHRKNMLSAADGNVSYRISDKEILITPSGVSKAFVNKDEMAVIDLDNRILKGNPSGERLMHLEVYRKCVDAKAVVHAHPPTAIAFTVAFPEMKELPAKSLSEVILAAGKIPIADYARPGTLKMGEVLHTFLPDCRAILLSRHGALCWGESLDEAYFGMERVEHSAEILYKAKVLNGLSELPESEVRALYELRAQLGKKLL